MTRPRRSRPHGAGADRRAGGPCPGCGGGGVRGWRGQLRGAGGAGGPAGVVPAAGGCGSGAGGGAVPGPGRGHGHRDGGGWLAGAAYLPLDPGCPAARLGYMLAASRAGLLVGRGGLLGGFAGGAGARWSWTDRPGGGGGGGRDARGVPPPGRLAAGRLAYVIFTSGSTGAPKGVAVPHARAGEPGGGAERRVRGGRRGTGCWRSPRRALTRRCRSWWWRWGRGRCWWCRRAGQLLAGAELAAGWRGRGSTHLTVPPAVLAGWWRRACWGRCGRWWRRGRRWPVQLAGRWAAPGGGWSTRTGRPRPRCARRCPGRCRRWRAAADRGAVAEYPGVRAGPVAGPGPGRGDRGAVCGRGGAGARVLRPAGADRRAVHRVPVRAGRGADVPDRGPGEVDARAGSWCLPGGPMIR